MGCITHCRKAALAAALWLALALPCACARPASTPQAPPAEPPAPPRGVTQIAFVPDPTVPPLRLPPDEEIIRPIPSLIPAPRYPDDALEAGCGDGVVGLRIIVGETGTVRDVVDSPVLESTGGSCGRRFREESASAVRAWLFRPAQWRRMEPGEDMDGDGLPDYQRVVAVERIPVYLDVRIDFEVVDGQGRVRLTI